MAFENLQYTQWKETGCSMGLSVYTWFTQESLSSERVFKGTFYRPASHQSMSPVSLFGYKRRLILAQNWPLAALLKRVSDFPFPSLPSFHKAFICLFSNINENCVYISHIKCSYFFMSFPWKSLNLHLMGTVYKAKVDFCLLRKNKIPPLKKKFNLFLENEWISN